MRRLQGQLEGCKFTSLFVGLQSAQASIHVEQVRNGDIVIIEGGKWNWRDIAKWAEETVYRYACLFMRSPNQLKTLAACLCRVVSFFPFLHFSVFMCCRLVAVTASWQFTATHPRYALQCMALTHLPCPQWLNCPATGGGSLSLKLLDYTFVRLGEKFRTSIKHSVPPCTRKVCFCSQLKYTEP